MMANNYDEIVRQLTNQTAANSKSRTKRYYLFTLIPFIAGLGLVIVSYWGFKVNEKNADIQQQRYDSLTLKVKAEETTLLALRDSIQMQRLQSKGYDVTQGKDILNQSIQADNTLLKVADQSKISPTVTIQYFRKTIDDDRLWLAMKELGYKNFNTSQPLEGARNVRTNCVNFGSQVKLYDLKLVLYTLIRAGCEIKIIQPFQAQQGRENLIQILGAARADNGNFKAISVEQVNKAQSIEELIWND